MQNNAFHTRDINSDFIDDNATYINDTESLSFEHNFDSFNQQSNTTMYNEPDNKLNNGQNYKPNHKLDSVPNNGISNKMNEVPIISTNSETDIFYKNYADKIKELFEKI